MHRSLSHEHLSKYLSPLNSLCKEYNQLQTDFLVSPCTVATVTDQHIDLSEICVSVKSSNSLLVGLWSRPTLMEKIKAKKAEKFKPTFIPPRVSQLAIIPYEEKEKGLYDKVVDEEHEKNEEQRSEDEAEAEESQPALPKPNKESEVKALRKRLLSLEQKLGVEKGLVLKKTLELEEKQQKLDAREESLQRKEKLSSFLQRRISRPVGDSPRKSGQESPRNLSAIKYVKNGIPSWK
jgi:hypothetical protein